MQMTFNDANILNITNLFFFTHLNSFEEKKSMLLVTELSAEKKTCDENEIEKNVTDF